MVERAWAWSLHESIPSNVDDGHRLIEQLMSALNGLEWEGRDLFHVQMAAEEAMVNAVTHGNQCDENKRVEIEFKVTAESVYMRFKDQGQGFCPADLPDPRDEEHLECTNGRGVMLIREMMSQVIYNERGNEVTMVKHRSIPVDEAAGG
jgi:serine/threonine-protein kinase RsbW